MIEELLLEKYGSNIRTFKKEEIIFHEGDKANYYYQIIKGKVKMSYYNESGDEFVLGIFSDKESFGEPPIFGGFDYPANAEAVEETSLYILSYEKLIELLKDNFDVHLKITSNLSKRIAYKSFIMKEIAVYEPEHRVLSLIDYFKKNMNINSDKYFKIPFTRQQIANMTGLSVETVIRVIKKLEQKEVLKIVRGKIYR